MQKKDVTPMKTAAARMKKGYIMELVQDSAEETEPSVETRSRRGSRDIRDVPSEDKLLTSQGSLDISKTSLNDGKKKGESMKTVDEPKKLGISGTSKTSSPKLSVQMRNQTELSLSAVLKSPPDLRIPPSIKRPLTAVGITNPMAIAAAAAVVCKSSSSKQEDKGRLKDSSNPKDKKGDVKSKDSPLSQSKPNAKNKITKEEDKSILVEGNSKQATSSDSKSGDTRRDVKLDTTKSSTSPVKKTVNTSDEDSKPIISIASRDVKKTKLKVELVEYGKDDVAENTKTVTRTLRKNGLKGLSDEEESGTTKATQKVNIKRSSDEEDFKSSLRTRRLANRSLKKTVSSDDEGAKETGSQPSDGDNKSVAHKKASSTDNESEVDTKRKSKLRHSSRSKSQSSDDESLIKTFNPVTKKTTRPSNSGEDGSENEGSDDIDVSDDDASPPGVRPSTRSAARSKADERKSISKHKRVGRKLPNTDVESLLSKGKHRQKSEEDITSSEEESESGKVSSMRMPKTRSKTTKSIRNDKEVHAESSGDESIGKSPQPRSRLSRSKTVAIEMKVKSSGLRNSSSESVPLSLSDDDDDYLNEDMSMGKSKKKTKTPDFDTKTSLKKSRSKRLKTNLRSDKDKLLSDSDSDGRKKKNEAAQVTEDGCKSEEDVKPRQSRSPRRSSRRSIRSQIQEGKNNSSRSESSESSGSSPSQNRRVLRERRGFFSFAEVDPPSDSEEDVIAATKASLEMINQLPFAVHELTGDVKTDQKISTSDSCDKTSSIQPKTKSLDGLKSTKKAKAEPAPSKKSHSKKRVKPPSEVQLNLNEELEKTLLSINLSPQMPKTVDRSPEGPAPAIIIACSTASQPVTLGTSSSLSCASSCPPNTALVKSVPVGAVPSSVSRQRKSASRSSGLSTSHASVSSVSPVTISSSFVTTTLPTSTSGLSFSTLHRGSSAPLSGVKVKSISVSSLSTISVTPKPLSVMASVTSPPVVPIASAGSSLSSSPVTQSVSYKGSFGTCNIVPYSGVGGVSTAAISSALSTSASLPVPVPMSTPVPSAMTTAGQAPIPTVSAPLQAPLPLPLSASMAVSMPMSMPVSLQGTLTTQLGIPMQTSVNVPMSVPMSGTMTLPLQVGSHSSASSTGAPFLLPVQSTLTPMLAPGQTIIKKESGSLGGMPNPVGNTSSLMVGMNPLVVNNNRTYFLSTGSTMSMATSSQQQMIPGSVMPSLLSLRLPDKPAGQQTIMAGSPMFVPFAFGNPGIIQTQGQVQPQLQTVTGVSTISAMATNIQNTVATNIQNSVAADIQNTMANIPHAMTTNLQNAITANIQNTVAGNVSANMQNTMLAKLQNSSSMSSAVTFTQTQGVGTGTGMKQQIVLATKKNGPVSKFILSVGEDGSHVLTEYAGSSTISTSEGQSLMSVMQPGQPMKALGQVMNMNTAVSQSLLSKPSTVTRPTSSTIAPKVNVGSPRGIQPMSSCPSGAQILKQQTTPSVSVSLIGSGPVGNVLAGSSSVIPASVSTLKTQQTTLPLSITCLSSAATVQSDKTGLTSGTTTIPLVTGTSGAPMMTSSISSVSKSPLPVSASNFPVSSTNTLSVKAVPNSSGSVISIASSVPSVNVSAPNPVLCGKVSSSVTTTTASSFRKADPKGSCVTSTKSSVSYMMSTSSPPAQLPIPSRASTHAPASTSSVSTLSKNIATSPSVVNATSPSVVNTSSSSPVASRMHVPVTTITPQRYSPLKIPVTGSPIKSFSKPVDLKPSSSTSVNTMTSVTVTSRIPSAPAALAALKSASTTPTSTRVIAKTGSSRKPYSTAASYSAGKAPDLAAPLEIKPALSGVCTSSLEPSVASPSSSSARVTISPLTQKLPATLKAVALSKPTLSASLSSQNKSSASNPDILELKRKGTEVELAPTHRTLSMLSTAFPGNVLGKEKKRPNAPHDKSTEKQTEANIEKSGLDSLAEVATSLAERSAETSSSNDKRTPEHSLWANPAQILGRETLRVPGLPITANIGANLPTKNDLAKMKSGAVLAEAVEKRIVSESDKKLKVNSSGNDNDKPSVSGLLTSSKADTPRQKVQKWLDDGSKGDVEHKGNCGLLSNGNSCTCDVVQEDISNLNSLAELCVSMERINSPVKDEKIVKASIKAVTEKKKKQDPKESVKNVPSSLHSPSKSAHPLDSHQMKVTWQNAFGVKSSSKSSKPAVPAQPKKSTFPSDLKKNQTQMGSLPGKHNKMVAANEVQQNTFFQSTSQGQSNGEHACNKL